MSATQDVAAATERGYALDNEHLPNDGNTRQDDLLALIVDLEFESKFDELLCSIERRLPRL